MLAEPFKAEVSGVYTPADVADVMPWMGEGFLGGVQTTALESLMEAAQAGEKNARAAMDACKYAKKQFISLQTPVWAGLSAESRLSDVGGVLQRHRAGPRAAGGGVPADGGRRTAPGLRRPRRAEDGRRLAVAWDGGKEASRAARLALPLLEKAARVVILAAPKASSRSFDPARLQAYYAARGVKAEIDLLPDTGDAAPALLHAASKAKADILVAGAFGIRACRVHIRRHHAYVIELGPAFAVSISLGRIRSSDHAHERSFSMQLSRIVMRLARNPGTEFAGGDDHRGYALTPPLTDDGLLDEAAYGKAKDACHVRRFAPDEDPIDGRLARKGQRWFFDYDDDDAADDEPVHRLGQHRFAVGEYVTVTDEDGRPLTYKVVEVQPAG